MQPLNIREQLIKNLRGLKMKIIDPSVPRRRYWSDDVGGKEVCPKCGHELVNEQHTYVMVVRQAGKIEPFMVGAKAGYFCPECPTVVLDREGFEEYARIGMKNAQPAQFTILGLIDLAAIPPEKLSQPLGAEENPIPLVAFIKDTNEGSHRTPKSNASTKKRKEKGKTRR